jgi:hypothetical protein
MEGVPVIGMPVGVMTVGVLVGGTTVGVLVAVGVFVVVGGIGVPVRIRTVGVLVAVGGTGVLVGLFCTILVADGEFTTATAVFVTAGIGDSVGAGVPVCDLAGVVGETVIFVGVEPLVGERRIAMDEVSVGLTLGVRLARTDSASVGVEAGVRLLSCVEVGTTVRTDEEELTRLFAILRSNTEPSTNIRTIRTRLMIPIKIRKSIYTSRLNIGGPLLLSGDSTVQLQAGQENRATRISKCAVLLRGT